ncbi:MAG: intradiol ring-cleavage dioxygenase [Alphaproteobacteria bacterium]|nr:intradiol ring-cleavage dioxygenase [Alphaproteobacteria bacterium]
MRNLTEETATEAVLEKLEGTEDPRLKAVMTSLIKHLHGFIREIEPTEEEWMAGIRFLTEVGQKCDDVRQEFILLSDVLGVTILVDSINHRVSEGLTETSVLGPFYVDGAPLLSPPVDIAGATEGTPLIVSGRVRDPDGAPIAGALLDVWQTAPNGLYDVQDSDQPAFNLRGRMRTDADGGYEFRTVLPVSYPIATDGPVGRMLEAVGRHPYRPAHVHFIVSAEGFAPVTTQLFVEGDPYIDSDAVFGVKDTLVVPFGESDDPTLAERWGLVPPVRTVAYDFGLKRQA